MITYRDQERLVPTETGWTFKGFEVKQTTDTWALKYGLKYEYFKDEKIHHAKSLDSVVDEISEMNCNE